MSVIDLKRPFVALRLAADPPSKGEPPSL